MWHQHGVKTGGSQPICDPPLRKVGVSFDSPDHPGSPPLRTTRVSRYQKGKAIWILQKQETVSGSGVSWVVCKSTPCCRQITMPVPHHSVFYRPDALPATQPTVSKHWRQFYLVVLSNTHTHTHTHIFLGLLGWSGTRKVKPIWILLKQDTVSGSGISWAICKSASCSRQITTHASTSPLSFFTGWMPFLPPNQQRQSTEGQTAFI